MPYIGLLKQGATMNVSITSAATDRVAVTILKVNRQDKISEAEPSSVMTAGVAQNIATTIGARIDRVLVMIAPPAGGSASVRVDQFPPVNVDGDTQLVFDCEP
jgi:hypothetical protein